MARARIPKPDGGRRDVFSARERASITREFYDMTRATPAEAILHSTKRGIQYELRYEPVTKNILWKVCLYRRWKTGVSTMATDALAEIAHLIENKELLKKLDAEAAAGIATVREAE